MATDNVTLLEVQEAAQGMIACKKDKEVAIIDKITQELQKIAM
jgi:hypothetical protein